jgi:hypothetical protein
MNKELESIIEIGSEERNIEFKRDENWDTLKYQIIKSSMALANRRDGGYIVIGMEELKNQTFKRTGVCEINLKTFDRDTIEECVNEFAEPSVRLHLETIMIEKYINPFLFIIIDEFIDTPVICKKEKHLSITDTLENSKRVKPFLEKGTIYYRSASKNETTKIKLYEDMKEIIDLTVLKGMKKYIQNLEYIGIKFKETKPPNDEAKFKQQRGE